MTTLDGNGNVDEDGEHVAKLTSAPFHLHRFPEERDVRELQLISQQIRCQPDILAFI